ncbi:MAG: ribosomal L7Ae/L30e/S12e/Gadd45 family protein [Clostridia bacterium]|nr:ribosomal L7Ae/L30e/S12e/Gadd45 family protein [Clostridia bacterium]
MKIDKIKTYLGFSIKSGKVIFGVDKLLETKKVPKLVVICSSQNEKVVNKVIRFCDSNEVKYIILPSEILLGDLIGRNNCKILGICDISLATAITNEFQMENN